MEGYAKALKAAFAAEPIPANMQRLLDELAGVERR